MLLNLILPTNETQPKSSKKYARDKLANTNYCCGENIGIDSQEYKNSEVKE